MDIAEIRGRKRANSRSVPILLEPDLRLKWDELDREIRTRERQGRSSASLRDEIVAIEEAIDASTVTFTFKALGRFEWLELVDAHPPTDEDKEAGFAFNLDTIAPILISESSVSPSMTETDVKELLNDPEWGQAEIEALLAAAISVNRELRDLPKDRRRSAPIGISGRSSTTASREGSDTRSSSSGT